LLATRIIDSKEVLSKAHSVSRNVPTPISQFFSDSLFATQIGAVLIHMIFLIEKHADSGIVVSQ
jgi:hypothetical protein